MDQHNDLVTRRRTMNRQVIPSMLLSVLIVCVFSVLLYEREEPRKSRSSPAAPPRHPAADPAPARSADETPREPEPEVQPPAPAPVKSRAPAPVESRAPAPAPAPRPPDPVSERPAQALPGPPAKPSEPAHSPGPTVPESAPTPAGPRSAFTTAKDGESLEDIAIRVYGTSDQADVLWRANRDLLPKRDSAIPAGSVLRTPEG